MLKLMCLFFLVAFVAVLFGNENSHKSDYLAGALVIEGPKQSDLYMKQETDIGEYVLARRAKYMISGVVLAKHVYKDEYARHLSPLDLAIGWGFMSSPDFINKMVFRHEDRFLHWEKAPGVRALEYSWDEINLHTSNNHIIPANLEVSLKVRRVIPGDLVTLEGYLVDVHGRYDPSWTWNTSLVRTDTGDGACELFLVRSIEIERV